MCCGRKILGILGILRCLLSAACLVSGVVRASKHIEAEPRGKPSDTAPEKQHQSQHPFIPVDSPPDMIPHSLRCTQRAGGTPSTPSLPAVCLHDAAVIHSFFVLIHSHVGREEDVHVYAVGLSCVGIGDRAQSRGRRIPGRRVT